MSVINSDVTRKIAKLARLKISEDEVTKYTKDLSAVLDYVAQLKEVNTSGVEPMIHGVPLPTHYREDVAHPISEDEVKKFLACSDQTLYEQFKVPQVIGEA